MCCDVHRFSTVFCIVHQVHVGYVTVWFSLPKSFLLLKFDHLVANNLFDLEYFSKFDLA